MISGSERVIDNYRSLLPSKKVKRMYFCELVSGDKLMRLVLKRCLIPSKSLSDRPRKRKLRIGSRINRAGYIIWRMSTAR